ncbi:MAG: GTPase ObgE [Bacteroidetes bacterium]|nr:GTPase ObgE [Bacteroidota bacterium]
MALKNNFVDYVKLYCSSGNGGAGVVSWRREKFVPHGGPDGGDGGDGGSIVIEGNAQYWTLLDLKYRKFVKAAHGQPGQGARKKGKRGADEVLRVPLGTIVKDDTTGQVLGEITTHGQQLIAVPGGYGGLGNWQFRSAANQTPEYAQPGTPGQERILVLELKVLADVGLVGFPNAGKSTLLSVVTAARPEIADYPFTTLVPNLGIVRYRDWQSFVMADIPGIIEGASEGKGLGTRFLRHIERNAVLLYMVSADTEDIRAQYGILRNELITYDPSLGHTPSLLAISKTDLLAPGDQQRLKKELADLEPLLFSSVTEAGVPELLDALWMALQKVEKTREQREW